MAEPAWSLLCVVRKAFGAERAEGDPLHSRGWIPDLAQDTYKHVFTEKSFIKQEREVKVAAS